MANQFTIIDGYNALHCCGFIPRGVGPGTLERARARFVGFLLRYLGQQQRRRTTIVFDSSESQKEISSVVGDMHIEFAVDSESADHRIEQLIKRHSAAKQLLVISSDHRLQRAARRRGASYLDSEVWFEQLVSDHLDQEPRAETSDRDESVSKRGGHLTAEEVDTWIKELGFELDAVDWEIPSGSRTRAHRAEPSQTEKSATGKPMPDSDIFPPGYADDLFDSE